jgi:hypothetical protein
MKPPPHPRLALTSSHGSESEEVEKNITDPLPHIRTVLLPTQIIKSNPKAKLVQHFIHPKSAKVHLEPTKVSNQAKQRVLSDSEDRKSPSNTPLSEHNPPNSKSGIKPNSQVG